MSKESCFRVVTYGVCLAPAVVDHTAWSSKDDADEYLDDLIESRETAGGHVEKWVPGRGWMACE